MQHATLLICAVADGRYWMLRREKQDCYRDILRGAVACDGAVGGVWLELSPDQHSFIMEAQYRLTPEMLGFVAMLQPWEDSACASCLLEHHRVVIRDVENEYDGEYKKAALAAGIRAVTSAPLIDSSSHALGVIALYHATPHHPSYAVSQQLEACFHVASQLHELFARDSARTLPPTSQPTTDAIETLLSTCGRTTGNGTVYHRLGHHLDAALRDLTPTPSDVGMRP